MRIEYVEAVLAIVDLVPAGSAVTYGDVAELLGAGGPRQVGAVLSNYGTAVPWWRVIKAGGQAPDGHEVQALRRYLKEGTPLYGAYETFLRTGEGRWRVAFPAARWVPTDQNLDCIEGIARKLERRLQGMSVADDGMSV
ncbi:cysteine methyltransferase [Pseudarthrobacter sp. NamE2]|uniref:MGMT family protein n=1 Tax=Pseudarthrobacter sp. NamE2 TaxID=2576838 RepID=UPI0010FEF3F0|nr:MGMT family protein [Pseudarthrobacter sp. NamE2]TLM85600.1 cysteine methyltransferase [Pseudarthrobacter sp. NamE2]